MSLYYNEEKQEVKTESIVFSIILGVAILWGVLAFVGPVYRVWHSMKSGEAEYAQAQQNRNIVILEAQAQNEAATSQAEAKIKQATAQATAEIERAKGVAQANKIIGDSLKGNEDYLRYLYITGLAEHAGQIIYIPTEAGLPILEARPR